MTAAERQRDYQKRYRERQKRGVFVAPVECDETLLDALERRGLLSSNDADKPTEVGKAVERFIKAVSHNAR